MECKTCRFWHKAEEQYVFGDCHRYPPVTGFTFDIRPGKWGEGGSATISRNPARTEYPNTNQDEWCGEWRVENKSHNER